MIFILNRFFASPGLPHLTCEYTHSWLSTQLPDQSCEFLSCFFLKYAPIKTKKTKIYKLNVIDNFHTHCIKISSPPRTRQFVGHFTTKFTKSPSKKKKTKNHEVFLSNTVTCGDIIHAQNKVITLIENILKNIIAHANVIKLNSTNDTINQLIKNIYIKMLLVIPFN